MKEYTINVNGENFKFKATSRKYAMERAVASYMLRNPNAKQLTIEDVTDW